MSKTLRPLERLRQRIKKPQMNLCNTCCKTTRIQTLASLPRLFKFSRRSKSMRRCKSSTPRRANQMVNGHRSSPKLSKMSSQWRTIQLRRARCRSLRPNQCTNLASWTTWIVCNCERVSLRLSSRRITGYQCETARPTRSWSPSRILRAPAKENTIRIQMRLWTRVARCSGS